ncbi:MAG TPA: hypothetical protein VFL14_16330 [Xanthomonadales bacterium]|nr:hypothetical protein [Xanthomonadales bacterium]
MRDTAMPLDPASAEATQERIRGPHPMRGAAGKELLAAFARAPSRAALDAFYRARRRWCAGTTRIAHRAGSVSPWSDAPPFLRAAALAPVADWTVAIATEEPWETVGCALDFAMHAIAVRPLLDLDRFADVVPGLREKAARAGILGVEDEWQRFLRSATLSLAQGGAFALVAWLASLAPLPHWRTLLPTPAMLADSDPDASCGLGAERVERAAQDSARCGVMRLFAGRFETELASWWWWRCQPRDPAWGFVPHVFVRRLRDGTAIVDREHFSARGVSPQCLEDFMMRHEAVERRRSTATAG